ncbi:MAG: DUF1592 domain-containing protein, partial [Pseudomonadota bacterium]
VHSLQSNSMKTERMRLRILATLCAVAAPALLQAAGKPAPMSVPEQQAFVDRYCMDCHNPEDIRGDMMITDLDLSKPHANWDLAEKVIRKVGVQMMPPPGNKSPDQATRARFVASLSQSVDSWAATHPDLGNPPLHRVNRTEYANSVRELLKVDVDSEALLPSDAFSHGFDNMADVLGSSPALMEAYVRAAGKVSRQALGEVDATPLMAIYQVPRVVSQVRHIEGTPLGTRGGISVMHDFPADGDYSIRLSFYFSLDGPLFGATQGKGQQIEVSVNGERVALFPISPDVTKFDEIKTPPIHIKAGPQRVSAAFVVTADGPVEDAVMPIGLSLLDLNQATLAGLTTLPHLHELIIAGPTKVTGISETPSRKAIFTCYPKSDAEQEPCARKVLTQLATRAYRHPATTDEVAQLMKFYTQGHVDGGFEGGVGVALQAILASPRFIYRFEEVPAQYLKTSTPAGKADTEASSHPISDLELASRLSYFLWNAPPDDQLLQLAADNKLHNERTLRAQVQRMLKDERSISLSETFASQWLHLQNLKSLRPDGYLYPMYDKTLGDAMRRETILFFDSIVREDRPVQSLLDARYTFVNEQLAALYGIPNVLGNRFRRVELADENRFGLLGKASLLALTSASNRTSPVIRGKYIMEVFLGTPPPPPPPDVPALEEHAGGITPLTVRARLEQHRKNPQCAGCHKYMDPIGFALENFDPIGAWRSNDSGAKIDSAGQLFDGTPLDGPASLRKALMNHSQDFINTFSESLYAYGMGRVLGARDMPVVRAIERDAAKQGNNFSAFVLGIVESAPFRMRAAPAEGHAPLQASTQPPSTARVD